MRFVLYGNRGLVDANLPSMPALYERLRLMSRRPAEMSEVYVLVFHAETDRYLGRRDVILDDGEPVLVSPVER